MMLLPNVPYQTAWTFTVKVLGRKRITDEIRIFPVGSKASDMTKTSKLGVAQSHLWHSTPHPSLVLPLTASTALVSILVTRELYCERLETRAEAPSAGGRDLSFWRVNRVETQRPLGNTAALFEQFLSSYAPTRNEYIITLLNNQIYKYSPTLPLDLLKQHPSLMSEWTKATQTQRGH